VRQGLGRAHIHRDVDQWRRLQADFDRPVVLLHGQGLISATDLEGRGMHDQPHA
jgi:hypothetical protein